MFKKSILFLFLCGITSFHSIAQEQITSATVNFVFVEKDVDGEISGFVSDSKIDWATLENSVLSGTLKSETISTGNFLRDWSLRGGKYFNADDYPEIKFTSSQIQVNEDTILVDGDLTIKDITKSIQFTFLKQGKHLIGTTTLFSSDFDITILKKGRESNRVNVKIDLELE
jgi:polyisoprenoid-binding protein YceI